MPVAFPFEPNGRVSRSLAAADGAYALFRRHLTVVPADSEELLDHAFRLRFQVYCVERGFENPAEHPDGRERDRDDRRSLHFLVLDRATGEPAGTVRLILPQIGNDLPSGQTTAIGTLADLALEDDFCTNGATSPTFCTPKIGDWGFRSEDPEIALVVPEPASLGLLASALIGFGPWVRRGRRM